MSEDNSNQTAPASNPVTGAPAFRSWLVAALLAVVTLALYWPATRCDFVLYDDQIYVTSNPHVQSGLTWANVSWAFTTSHALNWHPLTWLSLMLDVNLFGRGAAGFHFTNVVLHVANVVLLFWLLRQLTGATWRSALVAALFGWHPIHVESVAWIAERKDVLSTFFGFLSLVFYTHYAREREGRGQKSEIGILYGGALICFALGLMSKPMLVTWPFVLLLLDYWPLNRVSSFQPFHLIREKIPFFAVAAAACWVTFVVQQHGGAVVSLHTVTLGMRAENTVISYVRYLGNLFWPAGLSISYPYRGYWPKGDVLAAILFLAGATTIISMIRRRLPFLLMGWLWYGGTLIPVIGLVQVGDQAIADRYFYIPSVGVLILAVWGAHAFTQEGRRQTAVLSVAGITAVLACLALTHQQLGCWQNSETLFQHALAVTSNNYSAHRSLGLYYLEKGRNDEAIREFQTGLQLAPDDYVTRAGLGEVLLISGQTNAAIHELQTVLRLKPDDYKTRFNLGRALAGEGRTNESVRQFQEGLRLCPDNDEASRVLGIILGQPGRSEELTRQYILALQRRPDYAEACNSLGLDLARRGSTDYAISQFEEALRLDPDFADAHNNLGIALFQRGQTDAAISQFEEAVRLKPDLVEAHNNLGSALAREDRVDEMISQFQEALRLNPASAAAQQNLARALAQKDGSAASSQPVKP